MFAFAIAYCGDAFLYNAVHADVAVDLLRNVARGVLLGLLNFV